MFVECKNFIHDSKSTERDLSFREELEKQLKKLDKSKYEELKRLMLSKVDNEFPALANELIDYRNGLIKKGKESKEKSRLTKVLRSSYWESYRKKEAESFMMCEEALKKSVATGDDDLFYQAIKDIKKNSKYIWVFQVNGTLFNSVCNLQHDSKNRMPTFKDLASGFIRRRKEYIAEQATKYEIDKATKEKQEAAEALNSKSISDEKEKHRLGEKHEAAKAIANEERRGRKEAEAKAEEERKAKEEERIGREEAEAKVKAIRFLYGEASSFNISIPVIMQNQDVEKFLTEQYTFLILNKEYGAKFKNLCAEYKNFNKETEKEVNLKKLSELANEFERLSRDFIRREEEEEEVRKNAPKYNDQDIDRLSSSVVTRVVQMRDLAEKEQKILEKEKIEVEEIVKKLQMQDPNSALEEVNFEPVAGPSWQI